MTIREGNFSFGGEHCTEYGVMYVEDTGHPLSPAPVPDLYEISGVPGTVRMSYIGYETIEFSGTLYFLQDYNTQQEAQAALRMVSKWLLSGRKPLIFDYEPDRYYMAEVTGALEWAYDGWPEGGLKVTFTAQPYAYATKEESNTIFTDTEENILPLMIDTDLPAPVRIVVKNMDEAEIHSVSITLRGENVRFTALEIAEGESLTIFMETPAGAEIDGAKKDSALPCCENFDILDALPGRNDLSVSLTFGEGSRRASITASARGRSV